MIGGMTSQVAHELNNTLTGLLGRAQQALRNRDDPELSGKALLRVVANAERAVEICRGVLGLAQRQNSPKETVKLNDIIKEVTSSLARKLAKQSISLRCKCSDDLAVQARPIELTQVLLNMTLNSCQAMGDRGGILRICADQDQQTHCVNISVADSGPGIADDDIRQIFDPFFSTKRSGDTASNGGTGLGLAVCRDIITDHGGFIEVQSAQGQGATFTIFLPSHQS